MGRLTIADLPPNNNLWLLSMLHRYPIMDQMEDNLTMSKRRLMIWMLLYNLNKDLTIIELILIHLLLSKLERIDKYQWP